MKIEKLKYMEEVNGVVGKTIDAISIELRKELGDNFQLTIEEEDKIFDALQLVLCNYSETGDYKNYN